MPKKILSIIFVLFLSCCFAFADDFKPFKGKVNSEDINLRIDSTISSEIICKAKKGVYIDVLSHAYGWYRVRLPKYAPSFISDEFIATLDEKIAKIAKPGVNVRLAPSVDSPIIGKTGKDEVITVIESKNGWSKIEPIFNSFGWISAKFIDKTELPVDIKEAVKPEIKIVTKEEVDSIGKLLQEVKAEIEKEKVKIPEKIAVKNKDVSLEYQVFEGLIKPYGKIIKRVATHKLVDKDNKIFLLKGDKDTLEAGTYRKVRIKGKLSDDKAQKFPVIEVSSVEVLY